MKKRLLKRGIDLLAILNIVILAGCASHGGSFCQIYNPVYHSVHDTEKTRHQIDLNNVAYIEICE